MRISAELIEESAQFYNVIRERELDLRANKIPIIENLGLTLDAFDTIDLSDNDICKVDGFPLLKKLATLFLNNNRITKFETRVAAQLPSLSELILTNNNLSNYRDIDDISSVKSLKRLSLLKNPVCYKPNYRAYVIHTIPHLVLLDFRKVKYQERLNAHELFDGERGKKLKEEMLKQHIDFNKMGNTNDNNTLTLEQINAVKKAIMNAESLDEVKRLEAIFQSGKLPENFENK